MCPALYTPGAAPPVGSYRRTPRVQSPSAIEPSQRPLRPGGCGSISAHQSLARPLLYFTTAPLHAVLPLLLLSTHHAHMHMPAQIASVSVHTANRSPTRDSCACLSQVQPSSCSSIRSRRRLRPVVHSTPSSGSCHEFLCQCQPPCLLEPGGVASEATMHHASASHSRSDS